MKSVEMKRYIVFTTLYLFLAALTSCQNQELKDFLIQDGILVRYMGTASKVKIPSDIKSIGEVAFFKCKITSVTIPPSVTSIGDSAFYNCNNLASVTISSNITFIESLAFGGCVSLTSITLPANMDRSLIDDHAFVNPLFGIVDFYEANRRKAGTYTFTIENKSWSYNSN